MQLELPHGTVLTHVRGRLREARDRYGHTVWSVRYEGERLRTLELVRPDRSAFTLDATTAPHPLFRRAHALRWQGEVVARCAETDWLEPQAIPPVDAPARLPAGAGSALLNWLALAATRRAAPTLRYRGPYPTAALFDALLHSFRVRDPAHDLAAFTRDVEARSLTGSMTEVQVPFIPDPFEWHWPTPDICVQLREGVERIFIAGRSYVLRQRGPRRLRREGERTVAYLEFGGVPWHDVLTLEADGRPRSPARPRPTAPPRLLGQKLPQPIVDLLAEVLRQRAPRMLQSELVACLEEHPLCWGDTGDDAACLHEGTLQLHSALGERLPQMAPQAVLADFVGALEPLVHQLTQARLAL